MTAKQTSRFRLLRQGYDRFEVDRTIDSLELKIDELEKKLVAYQNQIEFSNKQIQLTNERYKVLKSQIAMREKAADEISRQAIKEANLIIDTANKNADIIVREALSTARLLLVELARISNQTSAVKGDLKERIDELYGLIEDFKLPDVPQLDWLKSVNKLNSDE